MDTSVLFSVVVCFLILFLIRGLFSKRKLPPGPIGLPILGYILFLSRKAHLELWRLSKKYGTVFRIRLGSFNVIIVNDFESTKEVNAKDAFMGRPPGEFVFQYNDETLDTKAFWGLPWKEHRRFSLHQLRDLGLGKSKMEGFIQEEISELLDHLQEIAGTPFKIHEFLASSMSNIISSLVFGKRLEYADPARIMTNNVLKATAASANQAGWQLFFPWVKQTMDFLGIGNASKLTRFQQKLRDYIMMEIEEHEKTFDPSNIRDFVDAYLFEIQKKKDPSFSKPVVQDIAMIFFSAGSETVRTSVEWLLLTAAAHQDFQQRIHQEIDEVLGRDRFVSWVNRSSMPFTEAFVNELSRWKTILPLSLLRYTLNDGELNGYLIPKGSFILSNLWSIHHDPDFWGQDADKFRPERFLTDDGTAVKKLERFMPFSVGKRACPGEPLAKVEVFMYFTAIMQKFHVKIPEGKSADFEGVLGGTLSPVPQDLIYTMRR